MSGGKSWRVCGIFGEAHFHQTQLRRLDIIIRLETSSRVVHVRTVALFPSPSPASFFRVGRGALLGQSI